MTKGGENVRKKGGENVKKKGGKETMWPSAAGSIIDTLSIPELSLVLVLGGDRVRRLIFNHNSIWLV